MTAIAIVSAIVLSRNGNAGVNPLRVDVIALQYAWTFTVPGRARPDVERAPAAARAAPSMLTISSKDVIHSFWVPKFGQKQDAVPGLHPTLHITPDRLGTYPLVCVELCGLGHCADAERGDRDDARRVRQVAEEPAGGDRVAERVRLAAPPSSRTTAAARCHTLTAAGATGTVGPGPRQAGAVGGQAKQPLESFVKTSITDPNAYIQPGYPKSVMPGTFGASLSQQQLDALVQYLISSKKG